MNFVYKLQYLMHILHNAHALVKSDRPTLSLTELKQIYFCYDVFLLCCSEPVLWVKTTKSQNIFIV